MNESVNQEVAHYCTSFVHSFLHPLSETLTLKNLLTGLYSWGRGISTID